MLVNLAKVFRVELSVLQAVAETHVVAGGVNLDRWARVDQYIENEPVFGAKDFPEDGATPSMLTQGVRDYTTTMANNLWGVIGWDQLYKAVLSGTRSVLAITRQTTIKVVKTSLRQYQFARALKGHLRGTVVIPGVAKAQFLGLPPLALADYESVEKINTYVGGTADPLWCLRVLL
jgi:hypothetical protein